MKIRRIFAFIIAAVMLALLLPAGTVAQPQSGGASAIKEYTLVIDKTKTYQTAVYPPRRGARLY